MTFGDFLCNVNSEAVTPVTWERRIVRAENARRSLGGEKGMIAVMKGGKLANASD